MKVQQLLREETYDEYIKRLIKTLGKRLGKGVAGSVFTHPADSNIAVKVFGHDPAYNDFLKWAHVNQKNPYVPKIYGVNNAKVDDGYITIAFFEKLRRINDKAYFDFSHKLHKIAWPKADVSDVFQIADLKTNEWALIAKNSDDADLAAFAKFMSKPGRHNDIHRNNIMKRQGDGHLVFIDPSSSIEEPSFNTLFQRLK